ncbi:hypothetical protein [Paenibacillus medicaginis]|uniref:Uncharacterized protein n=1 Tax=Paenibacillus medicaginis TaxID=1470560 RepID=A0ABV5C8Q7_9BACL
MKWVGEMSNTDQSLILQAINDLKEAKDYMESIKDDFKDDAELLSFYLPSAEEMVRQFEVRLKNTIEQEAGVEITLQQESKLPEIWIRLQGEKFLRGAGPIDAVGSFLHKLNQASHKVIKLLHADKTRFAPSFFNLVATAEGSLKLGLSTPNITVEESSQLQLDLEDPWDKIKALSQNNERALRSLQLIMVALDSEDEESMEQLQRELGSQNDVLKLLHYAKDIAPSIRSDIDRISFEGLNVPNKSKIVSADKQTRKTLSERAKILKRDTLYIEGRALIRQQDMDTLSLTARPLILDDNKQYGEVKCVFTTQFSPDGDNYLNKLVTLSGFLIFGANEQPLRLEIDDLNIEEEQE